MIKGLGRFTFNDLRDAMHLMRNVLTPTEFNKVGTVQYKVWERGIVLDQGQEGACVGFGWTAWENAKPYGYKEQQDNDYAFNWYYRCQEIDEWPGNDYSGTSVRAGAKVALERGAIKEYLWAGSLEEIDAWLINRGPIVVGSSWFNSMDEPKGTSAYLEVVPESGARGGHCYLLLGRGREGNYVFQNSWGEGYGDSGIVRMTPDNFNRLIQFGDAEFCTARQTAKV